VIALRCRAHAKINLGLDVGGQRQDGYHEVRTVLQSIALFDTLEVGPAAEGIAFTCSDKRLGSGEDNLVLKAARALAEASGCRSGARIALKKRIPMQAGLGGGSADAAVALVALARLWKLPWDEASLTPVARALGSDVPFFLVGGTALGLGRGDEVYALPDAPQLHLVLVQPPSGTSTAEAYRRLDARLTGAGAAHRIQALVHGVVEGKLSERHLFNVFEEVTEGEEAEVKALRQAVLAAGAGRVLLAGSGSVWAGIFADRRQAQEAYRRLAHRGISAVMTRTLARKDYWERTVPSVGKETLL
jgi:4-diphosphocytidyl-2-C-methyl-D-erythritol kinase